MISVRRVSPEELASRQVLLLRQGRRSRATSRPSAAACRPRPWPPGRVVVEFTDKPQPLHAARHGQVSPRHGDHLGHRAARLGHRRQGLLHREHAGHQGRRGLRRGQAQLRTSLGERGRSISLRTCCPYASIFLTAAGQATPRWPTRTGPCSRPSPATATRGFKYFAIDDKILDNGKAPDPAGAGQGRRSASTAGPWRRSTCWTTTAAAPAKR